MFILFQDLMAHDQQFNGFWYVISMVPTKYTVAELTSGFRLDSLLFLVLFRVAGNDEVVNILTRPQLSSRCWRLSNLRKVPSMLMCVAGVLGNPPSLDSKQ